MALQNTNESYSLHWSCVVDSVVNDGLGNRVQILPSDGYFGPSSL